MIGKRLFHLNAAIFLASAALTGIGTWGQVAAAQVSIPAPPPLTTYPASICQMVCADTSSNCGSAPIVGTGQFENYSAIPVTLQCPVVQAGTASTVFAYGWANGNKVSVQTCRTFGAGNGGVCTTSAQTAPDVAFHVQIATSVWNNTAGDARFVQIGLGPRDSGGGVAGLFSYTVQ